MITRRKSAAQGNSFNKNSSDRDVEETPERSEPKKYNILSAEKLSQTGSDMRRQRTLQSTTVTETRKRKSYADDNGSELTPKRLMKKSSLDGSLQDATQSLERNNGYDGSYEDTGVICTDDILVLDAMESDFSSDEDTSQDKNETNENDFADLVFPFLDKSEKISIGLSYVIGVTSTAVSRAQTAVPALYDCVLCQSSSSSVEELNCHMKSREHILNVVKLQNYSLFEELNSIETSISSEELKSISTQYHCIKEKQPLTMATQAAHETVKRRIQSEIEKLRTKKKEQVIREEYDKELDELKNLQAHRKPTNIVLVVDSHYKIFLDRANFENTTRMRNTKLCEVTNLEEDYDVIKNDDSFDKGTLYVIFGGHYLFTKQVKLPNCEQRGCQNPVYIMKPLLTDPTKHAIELHKKILQTTKNDNVIFAGLLEINIDKYCQFSIKERHRTCKFSHPFVLPPISKDALSHYSKSLARYNLFVSSHAEKMGYCPFNISQWSTSNKDYLALTRFDVRDSLHLQLQNHIEKYTDELRLLTSNKNMKEMDTSAQENSPVRYWRYDRIIIVADKLYEPFVKELKDDRVELVIKKGLSLLDVKRYILDADKVSKLDTLFLLVTGIFSLSKITTHSACKDQSCKVPLQWLTPIQRIQNVATASESVALITKDIFQFVSEIKGSLRVVSDLMILPPIPLFVKNGDTLDHSDLHFSAWKIPEFYVVSGKVLDQLQVVFNMFAQRVNDTTLQDCNIQYAAIKKYLDGNGKIMVRELQVPEYKAGNAFEAWKSAVLKFMSDSLMNEKTTEARTVTLVNTDNANKKNDVSSLEIEVLEESKALEKATLSVSFPAGGTEEIKLKYNSIVLIATENLLRCPNNINIALDINLLPKGHRTLLYTENWELFKKNCWKWKAEENVLYVIIPDFSMIGTERNDPLCITMKCSDVLHFMSESSLATPIADKLNYLEKVVNEVKSMCVSGSGLLVTPPCPRICISKHAGRLLHSSYHIALADASHPLLLEGYQGKWNQAERNFNKNCKKTLKLVQTNTKVFEKYLKDVNRAIEWKTPDNCPYLASESEELWADNLRTAVMDVLQIPTKYRTPKSTEYPMKARRQQTDDYKEEENFISELQNIKTTMKGKDKYNKIIFVGKKELLKQLPKTDLSSGSVCFDLAKINEGNVLKLLKEIGSVQKSTVYCLVLNITIITDICDAASSCRYYKCKCPVSVHVLRTSQGRKETECILDRFQAVVSCIQILSQCMPVIVLPLYPSRVYCDDENSSQRSHDIIHELKRTGGSAMGCFHVSGFAVGGFIDSWKQHFKSFTLLWNHLLEENHEQYPTAGLIKKYIDSQRNIFLITKHQDDFTDAWAEKRIWRKLVELIVSAAVFSQNDPNSLRCNIPSSFGGADSIPIHMFLQRPCIDNLHGLSYITAIEYTPSTKKGLPKSEMRETMYSCVLCNRFSLTLTALYTHAYSVKHLVNVMEIENHTLFKKYNDNLPAEKLHELVTEFQKKKSGSQKIVVTTKVKFADAKKGIQTRISLLKMKTRMREKKTEEGLYYLIGISDENAALDIYCTLCCMKYNDMNLLAHVKSDEHILRVMELENYAQYQFCSKLKKGNQQKQEILSEFEATHDTQKTTFVSAASYPKYTKYTAAQIAAVRPKQKEKSTKPSEKSIKPSEKSTKPSEKNTRLQGENAKKVEEKPPSTVRQSQKEPRTFDRVIVVVNQLYRPFVMELACEMVTIVALEDLKFQKLKQYIIERDRKEMVNTLWLSVGGIFSVANQSNFIPCLNTRCVIPLQLLSVWFTIENCARDISEMTYAMKKVIGEIKNSIRAGSDFMILPPIPAFIKNASSLAHQDLHIPVGKIPKFFVAGAEDLFPIKAVYDVFSKEVADTALQQSDLPLTVLRDYLQRGYDPVEEQSQPFNAHSTSYEAWNTAVFQFIFESLFHRNIIDSMQCGGVAPTVQSFNCMPVAFPPLPLMPLPSSLMSQRYPVPPMLTNACEASSSSALLETPTQPVTTASAQAVSYVSDKTRNDSQSSVAKEHAVDHENNDSLRSGSSLLKKGISVQRKPVFERVIFVGKKELIEPLSTVGTPSVALYYDLMNVGAELLDSVVSGIDSVLSSSGTVRILTVCCLAFDISLIMECMSPTGCCRRLGCEMPIPVLGLKSDVKAPEPVMISAQLKKVTTFIMNLSRHIQVIVLPLYPSRVFCDTGVSDHDFTHYLYRNDYCIVGGLPYNWDCIFQSVTDQWNSIMEEIHKQYASSEVISRYIAEHRTVFLIFLENMDFHANWPDPAIWKDFAKDILQSLVISGSVDNEPQCNLPQNKRAVPSPPSNIDWEKRKAEVDRPSISGVNENKIQLTCFVKVKNLSESIPLEFFKEFAEALDRNAVVEKKHDFVLMSFVQRSSAEQVAFKLNRCPIADTTLQARITGETGVYPILTAEQEQKVKSLYDEIYSKFESAICGTSAKKMSNIMNRLLGKRNIISGRLIIDGSKYSPDVDDLMTCATEHPTELSDKTIELMVEFGEGQAWLASVRLGRFIVKMHQESSHKLYLWADETNLGEVGTMVLQEARKKLFEAKVWKFKFEPSHPKLPTIQPTPAAPVCSLPPGSSGSEQPTIRPFKITVDLPKKKPSFSGREQPTISTLKTTTDLSKKKTNLPPSFSEREQATIRPSKTTADLSKKETSLPLAAEKKRGIRENFYQRSWEDLVVFGSDSTLRYFYAAVESLIKRVNESNFKVVLVSPSCELLKEAEKEIADLAAETNLQVITIGEEWINFENYQVLLVRPDLLASSQNEFLKHMTGGALIFDNIKKIIQTSVQRDMLGKFIQNVKSSRAEAKINKVFVCALSDSNITRMLSVYLGLKLKEAKDEGADNEKQQKSAVPVPQKSSEIQHTQASSLHRPIKPALQQMSSALPASASQKTKTVASPAFTSQKTKTIASPAFTSQKTKTIASPASTSQKTKTIASPAFTSQKTRMVASPDYNNLTVVYDSHSQQPCSSSTVQKRNYDDSSICTSKPQQSEEVRLKRKRSELTGGLSLAEQLDAAEGSPFEIGIGFDQQLIKEYKKAEQDLRREFEIACNVYKEFPELYPDYEIYYERFISMYNVSHGNRDSMWKLFWLTVFADEIKSKEWEKKKQALIQEYKSKQIALRESRMSEQRIRDVGYEEVEGSEVSKPRDRDADDENFSVEATIGLLESLSNNIGLLGIGLSVMMKSSRDLGITTDEALSIFTDPENVSLLNLVVKKLNTMKEFAPENMVSQYSRACNWTKKLIAVAKKSLSPEKELDINDIVKTCVGQSPKAIIDAIKTALSNSGNPHPSEKEVNEIYLKVCSLHFSMAMNN